MLTYIPDAQTKDNVWKYAEMTANSHKSYGRDPYEIAENIYLGKLGEIAYCVLNGFSTDLLSFSTTGEIDPGYDIIINNVRIDIKTTKLPLNRVFFNHKYSRCEAYAIITRSVNDEFSHLITIDKTLAFMNRTVHDSCRSFLDFGNNYAKLMKCKTSYSGI